MLAAGATGIFASPLLFAPLPNGVGQAPCACFSSRRKKATTGRCSSVSVMFEATTFRLPEHINPPGLSDMCAAPILLIVVTSLVLMAHSIVYVNKVLSLQKGSVSLGKGLKRFLKLVKYNRKMVSAIQPLDFRRVGWRACPLKFPSLGMRLGCGGDTALHSSNSCCASA